MRTLALPYTDQMAGPVYCYTFPDELNNAWRDLTRRYTREPQQLPYRDLTSALRYVSRDYATIRKDPQSRATLLLVRKQLEPDTIARLFATFERDLAERHEALFEDLLGPQVRGVQPKVIKVAKYLQPGSLGQEVPQWVYDVATWHAIELLKGSFKLPNGQHLTLRPDTDGNLVAYDHPLPKFHQRSEQGIHYISLTPITLPGYPGIVLNLDAHVSATTGFPGNARNIWIAPDNDGLLLTAGQRYDRTRGVNIITGMLPKLVDSFSIKGVPTQFLASELFGESPRIRARYASPPTRHTIGSGPGRKFLEVLLEHATEKLGTDSLVLRESKIRNIDAVRVDADVIADSLANSILTATAPFHLSVVYENDIQRARVANAIAEALHLDPASLTVGNVAALNEALTISFISATASALLDPGAADTRNELIDSVCAHAVSDARHLALVETSKERADKGRDNEDPKHQIRRALGRRGTVTQFIDLASAAKPEKVDHPARAAVKDLFRAAGLTATTPSRVFAKPVEHRPCVVVGVYTHERTTPAKRMISLAALITDGTDRPWQMMGYHPNANGWADLPDAIAAHHATTLTPFDDWDSKVRAARTRDYAERALHQLRTRFEDLPIIVYVDSSERFTVWQGLTNKNLASRKPGHLPHLSMAGHDRVSLVRVNTSVGGRLLQPVRDMIARSGTDPAQVPGSTKLYQLAEASIDAFYLVNRSRSDQAFDSGVRAGHRATRFELGPDDDRSLRTPWHAMTCTEFVLLDRGIFTSEQMAAISARLCGHPLAWDGRTSLPAPLHLADQILEDHPDRYARARSSAAANVPA